MTDDDAYYPEYRAGQKVGPKAAGIGSVGIMAGLAQLGRSGAPLWVLLGLPVLLIVLFFLLRHLQRRSWTRTGAEYVEAGTAFRVRRMAWKDIQAIEIVDDPGAATNSDVPAQTVVVYDETGLRTILPHLNSDTVFALDEEVHGLRMLWERLRGDDWTRLPEITASIAKARRTARLARTWIIGIVLTLGAFMAGCVLFVILLISGVLDPGMSTFTYFMAVPTVLTAAGVVVREVLSRRGEDGGDDEVRGPVPGQGPAGRKANPRGPGSPGMHT